MSDSNPPEVFSIPRGDGTSFLYAPLRRKLAVVNDAAVEAVACYLRRPPEGLSPKQQRAVDAMTEAGLLGGMEPAPPLVSDQGAFVPHEVTLFPTSRCNLRCAYCYADAGHKRVEMPWEVARAAVALVATNAGLLGSPRFGVGFHGGGEPTLAWDLLVRVVEHAREVADAKGLEAEIYAATNGVLSPSQRGFIAEHFSTVNVSFDGPPEVHDRQRPMRGGQGSYADVRETLEDFDARGFPYGLRATITAESVDRVVEIVEHVHQHFHPRTLHVEPAWQCGRCVVSGARPPSDEAFAASYLAAVRRGQELGIQVTYSAARPGVLLSKFCAAAGDGFNVLPEGIVTSCFEVTEANDPRAEWFHFGRYDAETERFTFDDSRLARLRTLSVENLPHCRDCFCRWHCAGDCLAKALGGSVAAGPAEHRGTVRCDLNRKLTMAWLEELVSETRTSCEAHPSEG